MLAAASSQMSGKMALNTNATTSGKSIGILAIVSLAMFTGCTICQECGDLDYPTYGGAWERTRRDSGRVASIFDPAGARSATLADRDNDSEDLSFRSPGDAPTDPKDDDPAADKSNDEKGDKGDESGNDDKQPSPSDRDRKDNEDSLRDLDLEDISVGRDGFEPPDL